MNGQAKINLKLVAIIAAAVTVICYFLPIWGMSASEGSQSVSISVSGAGLTFSGIRASYNGIATHVKEIPMTGVSLTNFLFIFTLVFPLVSLLILFAKSLGEQMKLWISAGASALTAIFWLVAKMILVSKVEKEIPDRYLDDMLDELNARSLGGLIKMKIGLILLILAAAVIVVIAVLNFMGKIYIESGSPFSGMNMPRAPRNYGYGQQPMQRGPQQPMQGGYRQPQQPMQGGYGQPMQAAGRFCSKCGSNVPGGSKFCTTCGNPMN